MYTSKNSIRFATIAILLLFQSFTVYGAELKQRLIIYLHVDSLPRTSLAQYQYRKLQQWSDSTKTQLKLVLTRSHNNWVITVAPVQKKTMLKKIMNSIQSDSDVLAVEADNLFLPQIAK